jgi:hypothetical protein
MKRCNSSLIGIVLSLWPVLSYADPNQINIRPITLPSGQEVGESKERLPIKGESLLGDRISIKLNNYERPLLVTGNRVDGGKDEDWMEVYLKLCESYRLEFDEFKKLVTPEFIKMTGYSSAEKYYAAVTNTRRAMANRPAFRSSILYAVELNCRGGEFVIVVEYGGQHVQSNESNIDDHQKTIGLFRKVDGKWKQESFDVIDDLGINLIPWNSLPELKALEACHNAIVSDGKLRPYISP